MYIFFIKMMKHKKVKNDLYFGMEDILTIAEFIFESNFI